MPSKIKDDPVYPECCLAIKTTVLTGFPLVLIYELFGKDKFKMFELLPWYDGIKVLCL